MLPRAVVALWPFVREFLAVGGRWGFLLCPVLFFLFRLLVFVLLFLLVLVVVSLVLRCRRRWRRFCGRCVVGCLCLLRCLAVVLRLLGGARLLRFGLVFVGSVLLVLLLRRCRRSLLCLCLLLWFVVVLCWGGLLRLVRGVWCVLAVVVVLALLLWFVVGVASLRLRCLLALVLVGAGLFVVCLCLVFLGVGLCVSGRGCVLGLRACLLVVCGLRCALVSCGGGCVCLLLLVLVSCLCLCRCACLRSVWLCLWCVRVWLLVLLRLCLGCLLVFLLCLVFLLLLGPALCCCSRRRVSALPLLVVRALCRCAWPRSLGLCGLRCCGRLVWFCGLLLCVRCLLPVGLCGLSGLCSFVRRWRLWGFRCLAGLLALPRLVPLLLVFCVGACPVRCGCLLWCRLSCLWVPGVLLCLRCRVLCRRCLVVSVGCVLVGLALLLALLLAVLLLRLRLFGSFWLSFPRFGGEAGGLPPFLRTDENPKPEPDQPLTAPAQAEKEKAEQLCTPLPVVYRK